MSAKGDLAQELFRSGCNCSQAVFCAFARDYGIDDETAKRIAAGLGGGVGRTREVCGAVTGASLVFGLAKGASKPAEVYPHVQEFVARFKKEFGSAVCRELLAGTGATEGGRPEERTAAYYKKRPCAELVRFSASTLEDMLSQEG